MLKAGLLLFCLVATAQPVYADVEYSAFSTGVFRFNETAPSESNATFRFFSDADDVGNGSQRIFGEEVPTSSDVSTGAFSGGDGFFSERSLRSRMDDFFYGPLGLFGCDSISDSRDGGIFGAIPCTSYPDVFGPVPAY